MWKEGAVYLRKVYLSICVVGLRTTAKTVLDSVPDEIRMGHLPKRSQKRYRSNHVMVLE
jgi:hypothetical protein